MNNADGRGPEEGAGGADSMHLGMIMVRFLKDRMVSTALRAASPPVHEHPARLSAWLICLCAAIFSERTDSQLRAWATAGKTATYRQVRSGRVQPPRGLRPLQNCFVLVWMVCFPLAIRP